MIRSILREYSRLRWVDAYAGGAVASLVAVTVEMVRHTGVLAGEDGFWPAPGR